MVTSLDINGDGYSDIALDGYIYLGGPNPDNLPDIYLEAGYASMGDLNGDGSEELLSYSSKIGRYVLLMGGTHIDNIPDVLLPMSW